MAKSNNSENEENFKLCVISMQTKEEKIDEVTKKTKQEMNENMLFTVTHAAEYEYLVLGKETDYISIPVYNGKREELSKQEEAQI